MLRRSRVIIALSVVMCACALPESESESDPESEDTPSSAAPGPIAELAELVGESAEALSQDPCIIGCAGAALEGCSGVSQACDLSFVVSFGGAWITCTEAVQAACGSTPGLYGCAVSCRARDGRG